jgi:hypothetical protein
MLAHTLTSKKEHTRHDNMIPSYAIDSALKARMVFSGPTLKQKIII